MNNNYEYVKRVQENKEEQEKLKEQLQNIIMGIVEKILK